MEYLSKLSYENDLVPLIHLPVLALIKYYLFHLQRPSKRF